MDELDPVARLANEIAVQFPYLSDNAAAAAIVNHIKQFWDPRMRRRLLELRGRSDSGLDDRARAAADLLAGAELR